MNPVKTQPLHDVFGEKVEVCFSDRSVDFVLKEGQSGLTLPQEDYLSQQIGFSIKQVINIRQIHGDHIVIASVNDLNGNAAVSEADGVVTNVPGLPIAVRTADCLPVFMFDPKKKAIGLVHAGWRGSEKQITLKAVKLMGEKWGCAPEDLQIAFGPSIRACCYEVGEEFTKFFPQEISRRDGKIFLDLVLVNKNQLLRYGVKEKNILDPQACTCCDRSYFSYRREGKAAGRHLSLMVLKG